MCNCSKCEPAMAYLIKLIDHSDEYPNKVLKEQLEPYVYNKVIKYNEEQTPFEISTCPKTETYCEIFTTDYMGEGIRAIHDISVDTIIGCYLGCMVYRSIEINWKYAFASALSSYSVDGSEKKSMMSIVNHSRTPNVDIDYHIHIVDGKKQCHIVFIVKTFIKAGEELFIDYGHEYWDYARKHGINEMGFERPLKRQRKITDYFKGATPPYDPPEGLCPLIR
jgi:hypothetical protein